MAFDAPRSGGTRQRFKTMAYQTEAVASVTGCFAGQPYIDGYQYRVDPGVASPKQLDLTEEVAGFMNASLTLPEDKLLDNIQSVQNIRALVPDAQLVKSKAAPLNLDIEMETGTGKTYCYIKTMFELNQRYGWSKFIVVVPSIAIREGVKKTFEDTADHFMEAYGKRARAFIYNSSHPHNIEQFSSDAGINVMIINIQAFAARGKGGKDQRRIYSELDSFQSRRPIDVISANRPILILDEPQKMEGAATQESLKEFRALFCLRYSATHKTRHNLIHRLDAIDAYNQRLVKKIAVRGIAMKGHAGANAYLYLQRVEPGPRAFVEMEMRTRSGIKREYRWLKPGDRLFDLSAGKTGQGLDQYQHYVVSEIDVVAGRLDFTAQESLLSGQAQGDIDEGALRRIQIRETIKAHLDTERALFPRGIKVLSLFFIDSVAKYRGYDGAGEAVAGEYAQIFEEEYARAIGELDLFDVDTAWATYLKRDAARAVHNGYFSIDKQKRLIDPDVVSRGEMAGESKDADAYDLILKDKARLLSTSEPVRFIFSHSALREGWDNPNVFTICTLKHSDNTVTRRQEVGRGLRICVDANGDRVDSDAEVHKVNVLTVVANESYEAFVRGFQDELVDSLSSRPKLATQDFFAGRKLVTEEGIVAVTDDMARQIYRYLVKNDYTDSGDHIVKAYHDARREGEEKPLPEQLQPYAAQIFALIDSVFSEARTPLLEDARKRGRNTLNPDNFHKKEFQTLWSKINQKAVYHVAFDTPELIKASIRALDSKMNVPALSYTVKTGEQDERLKADDVRSGKGFRDGKRSDFSYEISPSSVPYDIVGKLASSTTLTRRTIGEILTGLSPKTFAQYQKNPEAFMTKAAEFILLEKARLVIEHIRYDRIDARYDATIFEAGAMPEDLSRAQEAARHIFNYIVTDSQTERDFAKALEASDKVAVYAKLPSGFSIPTPVGNYNPDWAIAFETGSVKHVYFIAETKGSDSENALREIEQQKINCARAFFSNLAGDNVKYGVLQTYEDLLSAVS
tara:strand:- start:10078 stop:13149 length:3072 start_codon:yes stop_codon:yes gene_type:complete